MLSLIRICPEVWKMRSQMLENIFETGGGAVCFVRPWHGHSHVFFLWFQGTRRPGRGGDQPPKVGT
jgi:hypothetical protein